MRRDKRGQFYLLAAVVIIAIIVGFAGVSNSVKKSGGVSLDSTGKELDFESGQVLEYGVTHTEEELIEHFTTSYDSYAGENKEILFIVGDSSAIDSVEVGDVITGDKFNAYTYSDVVSGSISLGTGESQSTVDVTTRTREPATITKIGENEISVTFNEQTYIFEVKDGENFYFVISQTQGDEEYVVTN